MARLSGFAALPGALERPKEGRVWALAQEDGDPEAYLQAAVRYVDAMFSGGKAGLRPIYDELVQVGLRVGPDVKACPCQTIVPLYRNHVFAQIKIANRKRIDLGLALKDTKTPKRLINTGGFARKDRISHRIEITSVDDIDGEVKKWLKKEKKYFYVRNVS